jgi:hypothetical protein
VSGFKVATYVMREPLYTIYETPAVFNNLTQQI